MLDHPTKIYDTLNLENAEILPGRFKNFSGAPDAFNKEGGKRYFNVKIPTYELADTLAEDGWTIKYTRSDDPDVPGDPFMKVNVGYRDGSPRNPQIYKITRNGKTLLDEEAVGSLDKDEIISADICINPYNWGPNMQGMYGVSGWVDSMYVTIKDNDPFRAKYFGNETPKGDEDIPF